MICLKVTIEEIYFMHKENCFIVVTQCTHNESKPSICAIWISYQEYCPKTWVKLKSVFHNFIAQIQLIDPIATMCNPNVPSILVLLLKKTKMFQDEGFHISGGLSMKKASEKEKYRIVFSYHILNSNKISLVHIYLATLISLNLGLHGGCSFNFHLAKIFKFMGTYIDITLHSILMLSGNWSSK